MGVAVPYKVNIVLTDNGTDFNEPTEDAWTPDEIKEMRAEGAPFRCHSFEAACADLDIGIRSGCIIPCCSEVVGALVRREEVDEVSDGAPE